MIRQSSPLRIASLFSGIGGFELGFARAGHKTVFMCESEPAARAVLEAKFPGVPIEHDITKVVALPECDVVTAGWPCQDISLAGTMKGLGGERSGLIAEVFRIMDASTFKPSYVLLENVAFALDLRQGEAVRYATEQLEVRGYKWAYRILDTQNFGLPQRRRRVFILGALERDPAAILLDGVNIQGPPEGAAARMVGFYWTEGNRGVGWTPNAVPPLKGGSGLSIPSPPAIWERSTAKFFSPSIQDVERLQGFDVDWTLSNDALSKKGRKRWLLVGNAVSVPVIEWIARRLTQSPERDLELTLDANTTRKMPRAAYGAPGSKPTAVAVRSEGPAFPCLTSLTEFGLIEKVPLSFRAIAGFTKRLEAAPLKKNPEFLRDLRQYLQGQLAA